MCDCIKTVNAMLAEHNTQIEIPWFGPKLPFVLTRKLDDKKRGKPSHMFASYCPFWGEKYERPDDESSTIPSQQSGAPHD